VRPLRVARVVRGSGDGKIASSRAFPHFGIFIGRRGRHMAYMGSHTEEGVLLFETTTNGESYIDLSSAMTAVNRKQYHQFTRKGVPLCYHVTIHQEITNGDAISQIQVAPNTWTTRNACVKTSAAWKKQLKDAGIKMKDLSKYGRRLRIPLDPGMSSSGTGTLADYFEPKQFEIVDSALESAFETYTAPDGTGVSYSTSAEFTRFAIPAEDGSGDPLDSVEMNLSLLGYSGSVAANNYFGVVDEYLGSRGGIIDTPSSGQQTPDADNLLQMMFSSRQSSTEEIIDAVADFQEHRPYPDGELDATASPPTASNLACLSTVAGYIQGYRSRADGTAGAPRSVTFKAPLGLIKILGSANKDQWVVTIHAIYEM
jgi:hypothetical protein